MLLGAAVVLVKCAVKAVVFVNLGGDGLCALMANACVGLLGCGAVCVGSSVGGEGCAVESGLGKGCGLVAGVVAVCSGLGGAGFHGGSVARR